MTDNRGYPIVPGGGGSNPFDQSLNTTDDVKFNSTENNVVTFKDLALHDSAYTASSTDHYLKIQPVYTGHGLGPSLGLDASAGATTYIEGRSARVLLNTGVVTVDAALLSGGSVDGNADIIINRRNATKRARITFESETYDEMTSMAVDDDTHDLKIYNNNGNVANFTYEGNVEFDNNINNAGSVGDLLVGNGTSLVALTRGPPGSMLNSQSDSTLKWVHSESYLWKSTQAVVLNGFAGDLSVIGSGVGPGLVLQQSWIGNGARLYVDIWGTYKNVTDGVHILYVTFNNTAYNALTLPTYDRVDAGNFENLPYHLTFQFSFTSAFNVQVFAKFHPQYQPYSHTTFHLNTHVITETYPLFIDVGISSDNTFNRHTVHDLDVRVST